jgi:hypothetical protein
VIIRTRNDRQQWAIGGLSLCHNLSVHTPIHPYACTSLLSVYPYNHPYARPSIRLYVAPVCLSIQRSIRPSIHVRHSYLSIYTNIHQSIACPSVHRFTRMCVVPVCLSMQTFVRPSVCLYMPSRICKLALITPKFFPTRGPKLGPNILSYGPIRTNCILIISAMITACLAACCCT